MKKQILFILGMLFLITNVNGQFLLKNGVSANIGLGFSGSSHTIHSFTVGYQREVLKSLYINLEYTDIQGNQTFESLFGETPKLDEFGKFGEYFHPTDDETDNIFGRLIQIKSWSLGVKKYIQLGSKIYMAASISIGTNRISEIDIEGVIFDVNSSVDYSEARPVFGTYHKISGKVGFEFLYNLKDTVNLVSKIDYLSLESIITLSIGTTVSF